MRKRNGAARALSPGDAQLLQRIQNAAERAARLIRDLLDFTQARLGGRIPIHPRRTNLHGLLEAVVNELEAAHPSRIACSLGAEDPWGEVDPDRLQQVIENLVLNALKYGVTDGVVQAITSSDESSLIVQVQNNGAPIPAEKVPLIFEPLQRGQDLSQLNPDRSIGIGLYIVRHLVEAHRGSVSVMSSEEDGTTFTLRLPRPLRRQEG